MDPFNVRFDPADKLLLQRAAATAKTTESEMVRRLVHTGLSESTDPLAALERRLTDRIESVRRLAYMAFREASLAADTTEEILFDSHCMRTKMGLKPGPGTRLYAADAWLLFTRP